ncbi:hypothetical protein V6Z12_A09G136900 [Gossypium hirsutum]
MRSSIYGISFFFLFCIFPLVSGQLASKQSNTMITVSHQLANSSWNVEKEQNPCLWEGVTCNAPHNDSILSLSLSGFGLSNSSFLPLLCQINSLQSLDFSSNLFNSIPVEFFNSCGEIDGLKSLNFSKNMLVGSLPTFQKFVGLESLDLSFNSWKYRFTVEWFTGEIASEIGEHGNLIKIDLSGNHLNGIIPESFVNLTKLETLILSSNQLHGAIPAGLLGITTLQRFSANHNNFVDLPSTNPSMSLKILDLSYNKITGRILPQLLLGSNLQTVDLSYNILVRLRLGSNYLSGPIPSTSFLDNNSFTGTIPPQIGSNRKLALLNLAQNKLNGTLPDELLNLTQLEVLKLQLNKLSGEIPNQIGRLNMLSVLNISWNSLNGIIPPSISNCGKLISLNLQNNGLTGLIPDAIGNLKFLIPDMPQKLQISLNLSFNNFDGPIPKTLSGLNDLEVLDLSNNRFSGTLVLSNNQLFGDLPQFKPHVSVDINGNPQLHRPKDSPPVLSKKRKPVGVTIVIAFAAAVLAVEVVAIVNEEQLQSLEVLSPPRVIQANMLTANGGP